MSFIVDVQRSMMMSNKSQAITRREFLKSTGVIIGGLVSSTFLGSCTPSGPEAGVASPSPTVLTGLITEKVEPITVLINDSPWFPGFEKLVNLYEEKSGNTVNLDVTPFNGMLEKTNNSVTAATSDHDILNLNEIWYSTFCKGGFITPINDIDPDFKIDPAIIEYDYSTRWNHEKQRSDAEGTLYNIPINGNLQIFYYRQDLYDQAGLNPPETWEDMEAAAQKFYKSENFYGYAIQGKKAGSSASWSFLPHLRSFGGDFFTADWNVIINNDAAKKAINLWLDLGKGYGPPNTADLAQAELIELMITDKLLQAIIVAAAWSNMDNPEKSFVVDKVNTVVIPKPASEGTHATTSGIWVMGIPKNIPDTRKKAALTFLKWATTFDAQLEYTKFGSVPVRQDVFTSDLAQQKEYRWMKAMADSTPFIRPSLKFPEATQVVEVAELRLNQAVVGDIGAEEALDMIADESFAILEKAGYPVKQG
jgi:multiple sugar transport system substrate-binding protein